MTPKPTRRIFLGAAAATTAAMATSQARTRGAGANETVGIGVVGCGGRGRYLIERFRSQPDARVTAVCDLHAEHLARGREQAGGESVKPYADFRALLEDGNVDAVVVATNDQWHVLPTVLACQAGKDVYVEKPLGTSIAEGRAAVLAAEKYDRVVQIGTQQRSWDLYEKAVGLIRDGKLGEINEVKVWDYENDYPGFGRPPVTEPPKELDWDTWVGPAPSSPYTSNRYVHWYWFFDYGGGWPADWGVHHYDIVHWAMGVRSPISAVALGGHMALPDDDREWPDTFDGVLEYGPGPVAKRGFLLQYTFRSAGRGPGKKLHAKSFHGSDATLELDRNGYTLTGETRGGKKVVLDQEGRGIGEHEATGQHVANFLRCVKNREKPFADAEEGHFSSIPGHLMNISWRVGRKLQWDGQREVIAGDSEANALLSRSYRAPWELTV